MIESLKAKIISKWTALSVKKKIITGVAVVIIIIAIIS
jgi:flagellar biosynthesis/type III secretory pathway M-ring protein FliF/YscJ